MACSWPWSAWIDAYRAQVLHTYGGDRVEETVRCGYEEPEDEKAAAVLKPVCIYEAQHSREKSCEYGGTVPLRLIVPLTHE